MNSHPPHLALLQELLLTEKAYTHDLFTIISRIAAAYTPTDFPPLHLDHHFRLIESLFRFHKTFQQHPMPNVQHSSMGTLVHFFASLVHQLIPAYSRYCHPSGWAGRGGWSQDTSVISNPLLVQTLQAIEWPRSLHPPSHPYAPFPEAPYAQDDMLIYDSSSRPHASLTLFFSLPFTRLVYYKKFSLGLLQLLLPQGRSEYRVIHEYSNQLSLLLDRGRAQWNLSPLQLINPRNTPNPRPSLQSDFPSQQQQSSQQPSTQQHQSNLHQKFNQPQLLPTRPLFQPPDHQPQLSTANGTLISASHMHRPSLPTPSQNSSIPTTQPSPPRGFSPFQAVPSQPPNSQSPVPNKLTSSSDATPSVLANSNFGGTIHSKLSPSRAICDTRQQAEGSKSDIQMVPVNPGVFVQQTILDLQAELDTRHCLDVFTLTPKQCRLHLAPPTLAYSRSLRHSGNARFKFLTHSEPSPTESGAEIDSNIINGRLILITDLLIFCRYKDPSSPKPNQLSLMYPPLAGKHLQVSSVLDNSTFSFDVTAMKKSVIRVFVSNPSERDTWVHHLEDTFEFCRQIAIQKQATSSASSPKTTSTTQGSIIDGSNPSKKKNSQLPSISQLSIQPPRADHGTQSQPISPSCSHERSSELPLQHESSSSIQLDWQLSQLNLSQVAQLHSNSLQKSSLPSTPTLNHPPSSHVDNLDSIGPRLDNLRSPSSSHRVQSGLLGPSLGSPVMDNFNENRYTQDRANWPHRLKKMRSAHALGAQHSQGTAGHPPMPISIRPSHPHSFDPRMAASSSITSMHSNPILRSTSTEPYRDRHYRPPSAAVLHKTKSGTTLRSSNLSHMNDLPTSSVVGSDEQSPESENGSDQERTQQEKVEEVETKTALVASLKSKVFKKQSHSQWKSLGAGKIQVFVKNPGNVKQLVVFDIKNQSKIWISTIVLSDGVERVGRTGVAVDLSDHGVRTGIVYMLQLKNETSAHGLFEQLLEGSDRRPK